MSEKQPEVYCVTCRERLCGCGTCHLCQIDQMLATGNVEEIVNGLMKKIQETALLRDQKVIEC